MLREHLDPGTDSASRRPGTIGATVEFCTGYLKLEKGASILDAGCGPGLYCERFAEKEFCVTGIDIAPNSIDYAVKSASDRNLQIRYICKNYLEMDFEDEFDVVFMIWWDFCVLSPHDRKSLLANIRRALKPAGRFVFDVSTPMFGKDTAEYRKWDSFEGGFYSEGSHTVFENRFNYPEADTFLSQYIVAGEGGMKCFRIYHTNYTVRSITALLKDNGFVVSDIYEDLCGTPYGSESISMGIFSTVK